jgi:hypothetical protein
MEWNYQKEAEKRAELLRDLSEALRAHGVPASILDDLSKAVLDSYVSTQPPEKPSSTIEFVVMGRMGTGGGRSTKTGNIKLNIGKLLDAVAAGVIVAVDAAKDPLTVPLAALVIWNSLWRAAQVTISETEAGVLYTMWLNKSTEHDVPDEGLLEKCNALLDKYDRPMLTKRRLREALKTLERIETIERSPRDPKKMWWLREWVRVSYS